MTLKDALRAALANTSSQSPIDTETLAKRCAPLSSKGRRQPRKAAFDPGRPHCCVEAALVALYRDREVGWCQVTRCGISRVLWWRAAGAVGGRRASAGTRRRMGELSRQLLAYIQAHPGSTSAEAVAHFLPDTQPQKIRSGLFRLIRAGNLCAAGSPRRKRYYPTKAAAV